MVSSVPIARPIRHARLRVTSYMATMLLAVALAVSVQASPARAGNNWIGPAIAGAIVGGAIVGAGYRYGYRNGYYGPRYPNLYYTPRYRGYYGPRYGYYPYRRYYRPYYNRAPVVVYPAPSIGFRIYPNW